LDALAQRGSSTQGCRFRGRRSEVDSGRLTGPSDTDDNDRVRRFLRDFLVDQEQPRSYAGFSRGSVCQACGNVIKPRAVEYDVVAGKAVLRLDSACYRIASEITRASQENHQKSA